MEETDSHTQFSSALSQEEWSQIPDEIGKKLFAFVKEKLTSKAISETNETIAETTLSDLEEKYRSTEDALSISNNKLDAALRTINELESQISTCTSDIMRLQTLSNKDNIAAELRHKFNLVTRKGDDLAKLNAQVKKLNLACEETKRAMSDFQDQFREVTEKYCDL